MATDVLLKYFTALQRFADGKLKVVPAGTRPTKDTVALEAGGKRGSIRSKRTAHRALIAEIERVAEELDESNAVQPSVSEESKTTPKDLKQLQQQIDTLNAQLKEQIKISEQAVVREISLVLEVNRLKNQLKNPRRPQVVRMGRTD